MKTAYALTLAAALAGSAVLSMPAGADEVCDKNCVGPACSTTCTREPNATVGRDRRDRDEVIIEERNRRREPGVEIRERERRPGVDVDVALVLLPPCLGACSFTGGWVHHFMHCLVRGPPYVRIPKVARQQLGEVMEVLAAQVAGKLVGKRLNLFELPFAKCTRHWFSSCAP